MDIKKLKLPLVIIVIGLVAEIIACLLTGIVRTPAVSESDFNYSITYKLNGETKTVDGVYKCRFVGHGEGEDPLERYYEGEFVVDGQTLDSHTYTIDQKDGSKIYIVIGFNDSYLMGDTKNEYYDPFLEDPYLEAVNKEGCAYDEEEMLRIFDAEIVSWEYPDPIENSFVFSGFSILHVGSMAVMILVGVLVIVACIVFVKKDSTVTYTILDKLSIVLKFIVGFCAIPFIFFIVWMLLLTLNGDEIVYQIFLCIPAIIAFTIAASIALRHKGFTKSGFFIQFVGPALFAAYIIFESVIYNLFS